MKYKTTRKAIVNGCYNVKCAGYCELQNLLRGVEPTAYTCGVYGWNFDVYKLDGLTICTGYRGMPGPHVKDSTEYEAKAREIWDDYKRPYDERKAEVEKLLEELCKLNREED